MQPRVTEQRGAQRMVLPDTPQMHLDVFPVTRPNVPYENMPLQVLAGFEEAEVPKELHCPTSS